MLNITRLLAAAEGPGEAPARHAAPGERPRPDVVVWNVTRRCNLHCLHCHASASTRPDPDELTRTESEALVDDIAGMGVPALVLSGGEPLMRADTLALARRAADRGRHVAVSTNGTLVDASTAAGLAAAGVAYVGVSIDGIGPLHDHVRGLRGAFDLGLRGLRQARAAGMRVGLRFTLSRSTLPHLDRVLDLVETEAVDRCYVSHLVLVGRARRLSAQALPPVETRAAVERILDRADAWRRRGLATELVTGNNDADAAALYLRVRARDAAAGDRVWRALAARGGNASGVAIASVDFRGGVHPDQFWPHVTLGSVRERPLSEIWRDEGQPLLRALRARAEHLRGRCAACAHLPLCGGGTRVRAEALTGDLWAPDPACHLTREEVGLGERRSDDDPLDALARGGADDCPACECAAAGADDR